MPFQTACPDCQAVYNLADELEGRRVRCKQCQSVFEAEPTAEVEAFNEAAGAAGSESATMVEPVSATGRTTAARTGENPIAVPPAGAKNLNLPWVVGGIVASVALLSAGAVGVAVVLKPSGHSASPSQQSPGPVVSAPVPLPQPYIPPPPVETPPVPAPPAAPPSATQTPATPLAAAPPSGEAPTTPANAEKAPVTAAAPVEKSPAPRPAGDGRLSAEAREKVKHATVFIQVTYADGRQASGSGFFGSSDKPNLILTNAHVVGMLAPESRKPTKVEITLNSGEKNVKRTTASVLGVDRHSDLAVLNIGRPEDMPGLPAALKVKPAAGLQYLDTVYIFGFPLGKALGDEITIATSSVSSLRKRNGVLESVQVNGGMHHGNSGGPVVDNNGDVVGVAVAGIEGSLLNFAIPGERITRILNGGLSTMAVGLPYSDGGRVNLPVQLEMIDPSNLIKSVGVEVWTGAKADPKAADANDSAPRPGESSRQLIDVPYSKDTGIARGDIPLPELPKGKVYWLQPVFVSGNDTYRAEAKAQDCRPEQALHRKSAALRFRPSSVSRRSLSLTVKSSFRTGGDEDDSPLTILSAADFLEHLDRGDTWKFDYRRVKHESTARGKTTQAAGLSDIESSLGHLASLMRLDAKGNPADKAVVDMAEFSKGIREQMRTQQGAMLTDPAKLKEFLKTLAEFAEPIQQGLELTAVPLPNEDNCMPGKSWYGSADRPVPIETPSALAPGQVRIGYTYLGQRVNKGKAEAVIGLESVVTGKDGSEAIGGALKGTANVDIASGIATRVEIKALADIEAVLASTGKPIRVMANVSIVLERGL